MDIALWKRTSVKEVTCAVEKGFSLRESCHFWKLWSKKLEAAIDGMQGPLHIYILYASLGQFNPAIMETSIVQLIQLRKKCCICFLHMCYQLWVLNETIVSGVDFQFRAPLSWFLLFLPPFFFIYIYTNVFELSFLFLKKKEHYNLSQSDVKFSILYGFENYEFV